MLNWAGRFSFWNQDYQPGNSSVWHENNILVSIYCNAFVNRYIVAFSLTDVNLCGEYQLKASRTNSQGFITWRGRQIFTPPGWSIIYTATMSMQTRIINTDILVAYLPPVCQPSDDPRNGKQNREEIQRESCRNRYSIFTCKMPVGKINTDPWLDRWARSKSLHWELTCDWRSSRLSLPRRARP